MENNESVSSDQRMKIRAYGVSAGSVRTSLEELTGVCPGKKEAVMTQETGRVFAEPEIYSSTPSYCDCSGSCSGSGDGEGLLVILIVIAVLMIMVAVVWAVVMIAFSILTVGGFLKRRYRTIVVFEKPNREFLGKLAVSIFRKGGVFEFPTNHEGYDAWVKRSFSLHVRLKRIRQVSLFFGLGWGWIEVFYKLGEILNGAGGYDLWPLRYVMIAIFVPLLLYSPVLEIQFGNAHSDGEEMVMRLLHEEYSFSPDHAMSFAEAPTTVVGISTGQIRKIDY
ncbi:MAG: hypothetical protein RTU63_02005 [Candidatus Thorarchaeota archaeon]